MGKLYIIPTPIGNFEDITMRALRLLNEVDLILAEDTRKTGILLKHFEIQNKMQSYHKFNEHNAVEVLINRLLGGEILALVSDAGTPGISDPGFLIVRECVRQGVDVECLPGATAVIPALVQSGIPCDKFYFEGFLPPKKGRQTRLTSLAAETHTIVFYESPHRLQKTLTQLAETFGNDRFVSISREISKIYSETLRGSLSQMIEHFNENEPRGEFVVIVSGAEEIKSEKKNKKINDF